MEQWFEFIFLGALQGFTEPLPISSSGHLMIAQELLGIGIPGISFEAFVNGGSVIAMLIYFWADLWTLIKGFFTFDRYYLRYVLLLITSTLPLVFLVLLLFVLGIQFEDNINMVGVGLLITGTLLFAVSYIEGGKKDILGENKNATILKKEKDETTMTFKDAFIIGCGQSIAMIPGISRSGMTMVTALFVGLKPEAAFKYAFMMYIPAAMGSVFVGMFMMRQDPSLAELLPYYIVASLVAIIATYLGLILTRHIVVANRFKYFAMYCWVVGTLTLIFL